MLGETIQRTPCSALTSAMLGCNDSAICTLRGICCGAELVFQITNFSSCTFLCRQDADVCAIVHHQSVSSHACRRRSRSRLAFRNECGYSAFMCVCRPFPPQTSATTSLRLASWRRAELRFLEPSASQPGRSIKRAGYADSLSLYPMVIGAL